MTRAAIFVRPFTALSLLLAAAGLLGLIVASSEPASAQLFGSWGNWGNNNNSWSPPRPQRGIPQQSGSPFQQLFSPFRQQPARPAPQPQVDYSRAPPPHKPETPPTTTIAVLGDSMADWLGYGLEEAFSDTPEIGIIRNNRTYSGLIRYDSKSDTDWARVAREILAADKPNYVVMMLGLNDRQSIHERLVAARLAAQPKGEPGKDQPPGQAPAQAPGKPAEQAQGAPQEGPDQPAPAAHEPPAASRNATYEFRSEKWEEVYGKLIDQTIAALKSKGVPVIWVGLPAVRGAKSMADISYLNSLFRGHAEKAGLVYVDVWDGFVDEGGRFAVQGPDFEGQIRRLRTNDGVHFTKPGALKLAHYVEREIRRVMQSRGVPLALQTPEETAPAAAAPPGKPGEPPKPVAGPVVPLTTFSGNSEELLGGAPSRGAAADGPAARVLVKGDPVPAPHGRADDFAWPRPTASADDVIETPSAATPVARAPAAAAPTSPRTASRSSPEGAGRSGQPALGEPKGQIPRTEHRPRPKGQTGDARAPARTPQGEARRDGAPRPPMAIGPGAPAQRGGGLFGGLFGGDGNR